jgi:hypothetical protein
MLSIEVIVHQSIIYRTRRIRFETRKQLYMVTSGSLPAEKKFRLMLIPCKGIQFLSLNYLPLVIFNLCETSYSRHATAEESKASEKRHSDKLSDKVSDTISLSTTSGSFTIMQMTTRTGFTAI